MGFGILDVLLVNAKGLKCHDISGGSDPYVIVQYKTQEHKSTVAKVHNGRPTWNEKISIKVEYPVFGSVDDHYKLTLKLMDKDLLFDDFIGRATIYVKDVLEQGVENGEVVEVPLQKYRVVDASQNYHGEIQVALTFTPAKVKEDLEKNIGGWKESTVY